LDLGEQERVEPVGVSGITLLVLRLPFSPARLVILAIVLLELATRARVLWELGVRGRDLIVVGQLYTLLKRCQS
jgi:hypothetical protein